jgi:membrane fusion protein, multidrug efflux system
MIKYMILSVVILLAACSGSNSDLEKKKTELDKAQKEMAALKTKIAELEKEIGEADPAFAKQNSSAILVSTFKAEHKPFEHRVEFRGAVESKRNVLVSAQIGGEIQHVHVREGQAVSRGQVLVTLNSDIIQNSIAELKTSLELARSVHAKQTKLWEQKIGTEIQYLQAKNNVESLERRLATTNSQLDQTILKAPFNGTVDQLPARVGEMASPGVPLARMVSLEDAYIKADVSERFIGRFKAGDPAVIYFPAMDTRLKSTISSVSQVINVENRTFAVEVTIPSIDFAIKPNQVVVLELRDYISDKALSVPTRLIQRDEIGHFLFVVEQRTSNAVARKVHVTTGMTSGTEIEILDGLNGDELIVDQGYRDLSEGVEVEIQTTTATKDMAINGMN